MKAFEKYKTEVKEKWGKTEAYREYGEKTKGYSKETWTGLATEMDAIMADFAACMQSGKTADSTEAQGLVARLQSHISESYYCCTNKILAGLGQLYVADERFRNNIDKHAAGTAAFVSEAIAAHCL